MNYVSNPSATNTILLIIFLAVWTYTEITESNAREEFNQKVFDFMQEVEHDRLLERVIELEADVDELSGD